MERNFHNKVIEAVLYNNKWSPNGRSIPGNYLKRIFAVDFNKSIFGYYNASKSKLRAQYDFKVCFVLLRIGYISGFSNSFNKNISP